MRTPSGSPTSPARPELPRTAVLAGAGPGRLAIKLRVQLLRDLGPALSPHSAFLLLQGVETLSLRLERHTSNALELARWLEQRDEVETVHYAGLPSNRWYEAGQRYLPRGAGRCWPSS
ncbi:O-succinylhomoserine sulfhydrylase [Streptomyces microflavus]